MLKIGNDRDDFCIVGWNFSNVCNFSCAYCPDELHNGSYKFPDPQSTLNVLDFIKRVSKDNEKVYLELIGGEVTLWPELIEFLKEIKSFSNVFSVILTNGSRSEKWWKKFSDSELHMNTMLAFSCHFAFCSLDSYYRNLEIVSKNHLVTNSFIMDPKYFSKFPKILNLFKKIKDNLPVDCVFKVVRDKMHSSRLAEGYTKEMLDVIRNSSYKYNRSDFPYKPADKLTWPMDIYIDGKKAHWQTVLVKKEHRFKGWKCLAGTKRFIIDFNGDVFPCNEMREERYFLGNVFKKGVVKILNKHIVCAADYCPCKTDAIIPKYSPDYIG